MKRCFVIMMLLCMLASLAACKQENAETVPANTEANTTEETDGNGESTQPDTKPTNAPTEAAGSESQATNPVQESTPAATSAPSVDAPVETEGNETPDATEETSPHTAVTNPTVPSPTQPRPTEPEPTTAPATEPTTEPTTAPATEPAAEPTTAPTAAPTTAPTEHRHSYTTTIVPPTCGDIGYTVESCECGERNIYNYISSLGHTFGEWTTVAEPTTTTDGQKVRTCSVCGYQETETIDKLGCETHTWVVTEKKTVDAYPLRHYGYVTTACSVCGEKKWTEAKYFKPDHIDYAAEINTIISLVNAMRASEGLSQLTTSSDWDSWAATRAQELSVYYSHYRPNGESWGRNDGVNMAFGENISKNDNSGTDFYYNFLNSPQHCGLMKMPDATGIAVGFYVNENGNSYCAMVIYGPMGI